MEKGVVLWFDLKKGFGFIRRDDGKPDAFVHYSKILGDLGEYKVLAEGDKVEFETFVSERGSGTKKLQAINVRLIEE